MVQPASRERRRGPLCRASAPEGKHASLVHPTEPASITCGPEDLPFTFTLFEEAADMQAAYNQDLPRARTPPSPDGSCDEANYESSYPTEGEKAAGRIACRDRISPSNGLLYREMEWTNDRLLVLGFVSNRLKTWDELIAFWTDRAGQYAP